MELNEIKKVLYRENPPAHLASVRKDGILYVSLWHELTFNFVVPLDELGETIWSPRMDSKLLIRYLLS